MNDAGSLRITAPNDCEVEMTRVFDAPCALVFDAWTNPKHVPKRMLGPEGWTMPVCEIDLRPVGEWNFVWHRANSSEMEMRGVYREIKPPFRLVATESWGGPWPDTVNTVTFVEQHGRTTMTQNIRYSSKDARDAALKTGMKERRCGSELQTTCPTPLHHQHPINDGDFR